MTFPTKDPSTTSGNPVREELNSTPPIDTPPIDHQPLTNPRWPNVSLSPVDPHVQPTAQFPNLTIPPATAPAEPSPEMPPPTPNAYRYNNDTPTATPDPTSAYRPANTNPTTQMRNQTYLHRDAYALQQHTSRKDITRLACASYHHGTRGV